MTAPADLAALIAAMTGVFTEPALLVFVSAGIVFTSVGYLVNRVVRANR